MTWRDGLRVLLLLVAVQGCIFLLWKFGSAHAVRTDVDGPLTWGYTASALPLGWAMFRAAPRLPRHHAAALVVASLLASAGVAAVIALATGTIVTVGALNIPFLGTSFGWQMANLRRREAGVG